MNISTKIRTIILIVILLISSSILLMVNIDLVKQNRFDIEKITESEFTKAKDILKNYLDISTQIILRKIEDSTNIEFLKEKYGDQLKNTIDSSESLINKKVQMYKNGELTLNQAKLQAMEDIKNIRFDNGTGYIWINDTTKPIPKMIMHPILPELDGTLLDDSSYNCALGTNENLFKAAVDITEKNGSGFIDYLWPKKINNNLTEKRPKLSYVKLIKEFNWVIGTGIYIDDAVEDAKSECLQTISAMRYDNQTGYFWINDTLEPIPNMIMHPVSPELNGKLLNNRSYNKVKNSGNNIFSEFVSVAKNNGEGYVEYQWPKPSSDGNISKEEPKLSFVRLIKEWNWIVGTGFYIDDISKNVESKKVELEKRLFKLTLLTVTIAVIVAVLLIIFSSYVINEIIKPIRISSEMLNQMSQGEGDLTNRLVSHTKDEIGHLSVNFNNFMEKLTDIVNQIKTSSQKNLEIKNLLSSSTVATTGEIKDINTQILSMKELILNLNSNISETDSDVNQIIKQVEVLDKTVEDESSAIEESSAAINQMVASINSVSNITKSKNDLIQHLLNKTETGGKLIDNSTHLVELVNNQLEEIKEITTIINKISSQTNLLAMNAAIEAAHAGEAGKGFSVVADEIRKLATTTSSSIGEISNVIKSVTININDSSKSSIEAKKAFKLVDSDVKEFARGLNEITLATQELSTGGNEILEALHLLNNVSLEVQDTSKELTKMSESMKVSMKKANLVTESVTGSIEEVVSSSKKISNTITEMIEYNNILEETTEKLSSEISKFKT